MSQASMEAVAIATVSFTGDIIKGAIARVEGADLAPSVVEAAASEAAPMGDQVEQMAEAVVTDEAEAARKAEEDRLAKRQPKIQTLRGPRASRCCRQSGSSGRSSEEVRNGERCSRSS